MRTIFLGLAISLGLISCGSMKEPEFRSIENIRVTELGATHSMLALDLHYFNPNKSKLKLKEAEGDAWLDGKLLGHFVVDTMVNIPAKSDFRLPVSLQLDMSQVVRNTIHTLLNPEVQLKVEGKARVGKGGIFIRYPMKYEGKINLSKLLLQSN